MLVSVMPMMQSTSKSVVVLGSFVADVTFRVERLPAWGETFMGSGFALGPGGKGSNQAVAAARAGAQVQIVTKLGDDSFAQLARRTWEEAGVDASLVGIAAEPTGSAAILVEERTGENAIIVVPGACFTLTPEELARVAGGAIRRAGVLLTQLELPLDTVERGLLLAKEAGVATVLNPAPAPLTPMPPTLLALADTLIPNETEVSAMTGLPVETPEQASLAALALQRAGARNVIVTLGSSGAMVCSQDAEPVLIPAYFLGPCVETTGAGDAFCGAFAAAIAEGQQLIDAARFGCAAAGLSVTRPGTASSMPMRGEIDAVLRRPRL